MKKDQKTYFDTLIKILKNNKLIVYLWITVVTFTTLITIFQGGHDLFSWLATNMFEKNYLYKKIDSLNTKINIDKFIEILGTPSLIRPYPKNQNETIYIFTNKYYFIQANTNIDKNVKSFAVTSRKGDFNPTYHIKSAYFDNILKSVTLNQETFIQNEKSPVCFYEWWPKGSVYIEGSYLGGDGDYQSLFVGINDSGYVKDFKSYGIYDKNEESSDCSTIPSEFRKKNTFNTFMLSKDSSTSALFKNGMIGRIGVDQYDVNTLK